MWKILSKPRCSVSIQAGHQHRRSTFAETFFNYMQGYLSLLRNNRGQQTQLKSALRVKNKDTVTALYAYKLVPVYSLKSHIIHQINTVSSLGCRCSTISDLRQLFFQQQPLHRFHDGIKSSYKLYSIIYIPIYIKLLPWNLCSFVS